MKALTLHSNDMYTIILSKKERHQIKQLFRKEKRVKVYRRLQAVEMAASGHTHQEIATVVGVSVDTITDWIKLYQSSGLTELCTLHFTGKRASSFDAYAQQIKQDIIDHPIATLAELQAWIKEKYSLKIEQSWLFRCCKKNSMSLTKRPV